MSVFGFMLMRVGKCTHALYSLIIDYRGARSAPGLETQAFTPFVRT